MVKVSLFDEAGGAKSEVEVDETQFDTQVRWSLLKEAVLMYEANQRQGTHSTRTRSEREGSGKKPWRQKGTGRARAGSFRSPLWRKGGVIHGPKPRDYGYRMPKQALRRARFSAIYGKLLDGEVVCIEAFPTASAKTRAIADVLKKIEIDGMRVLISSSGPDEMLLRVTRNMPSVTLKPVGDVNAFDLLRNHRWLLTKEALDSLVESTQAGGES